MDDNGNIRPVMCKGGHWFDQNKYTVCPHCGEPAVIGGAQTETPQTSSGKKFWEKWSHNRRGKQNSKVEFIPKSDDRTWGSMENPDDRAENEPPSAPGSNPPPPDPAPGPNPPPPAPPYYPPASGPYPPNPAPPPYPPPPQDSPGDDNPPPPSRDPSSDTSPSEPRGRDASDPRDRDAPDPRDGSDSEPDTSGGQRGGSLQSELGGRRSASDEGKTVGYYSPGKSGRNGAVDPVVGWLVCVKGARFGESFALSAGRNSIGRGQGNRIALSGDNSVSREKHAWVIFEPKKREFYMQPGDGSGLTYVNGDTLLDSRKLRAYDTLELGEGSYVFIPLCGENFAWDDYIIKE